MHLIQDLSQPDHSRNDMHFFGRYRWIENYGENAVANLTSSANDTLRQRMAAAVPLNLTTTGFTRLRDFWDRDLYTATSGPGPLDQDAQGAITLGLAEYSNGNFLGEDALYFDSSPPDKTFPYPRLSSVSYASSPTFFTLANAAKLKPLALQNGGSTRYALFLEKTRDGVQVDHHSILLYSAVRGAVVRPSKAAKVGYSIQSLDVLKEYHEILLPKAISYSGGLLSYFFRGKLEVASGRDSLGNFIIKVTNKSNQAIKGGSFQIYVEDSNHIRSSGPALTVKKSDGAAWSESSILLHDEFVIAAFSTSNSTDSYRLIYKGTIGVDSNTGVALDTIDAGIALAVTPFSLNLDPLAEPYDEWDSSSSSKAKIGYPGYTYNSPPTVSGTLGGPPHQLGNPHARYLTLTYSGDDGYNFYGGANSYSWPGGAFTNGGTRQIGPSGPIVPEGLSQTNYNISQTVSHCGGGYGSGYTGCNVTLTLSAECTNDMIKQEAVATLPALDDIWYNARESTSELSTNDLSYTVRRGKYRIRFPLSSPVLPNATYRITWIERFMPSSKVGVSSIEVVSSGSGYTSAPTIYISAPGSGGTQATAVATLDGTGGIASIALTNPGSG
jgi:hypothetical protein